MVRPNALWPGRLLAEELERRGLGRCVCLELERVSRVQKNSTIRRGHERTSPEQHIESMKLTGSMESALFSADLTLVDDVVTRGSQLLGAASALRSGYPRSTIRAFAALRSMSQAEVDSVVEPVSGIIRYAAGTNASTRSP